MDDNYEMVPYKDLLELKKDIDDIPKEIRRDIKFSFAKTMDDVLKVAFR